VNVFVTGASGWIGTAVVPELLSAGHSVVGLARSDEAAASLGSLGVEVHRGSLEDPATLGAAASASDGVIHLAYRHDLAFSGNYQGAVDADRAAIGILGDALAGSDRPLVIASGTLGLAPGRLATEQDGRSTTFDADAPFGGAASGRLENAQRTLALADRGVRSSVVRLPPTCHGDGANGFMAMLVAIARQHGVSGYVGDGASRWPAAHRLDVARVFRLAAERGAAGSVFHAVDDEGVPTRDIAEIMGTHLGVPSSSIAPDDAGAHFGFLATLLALDSPASSATTRAVLEWEPTHESLLEDLDLGHYYETSAGS
jgi:nucleoside-diphosphate-sugar epimerase